MGITYAFGNWLAWLLLLPGDVACRSMGFKESESSNLIRMLVNSLVWTVLGVAVVSAMA